MDQLNRAALLPPIPARRDRRQRQVHRPDRKNFFGIAHGSVPECVPLLELALRRELLSVQYHGVLKSRLEKIARTVSGLTQGP